MLYFVSGARLLPHGGAQYHFAIFAATSTLIFSHSPVAALFVFLVCVVITYLCLSWVLTRPFAAKLLARPHQRSLHTQPTPNIGGLVFVPIIAIATALSTSLLGTNNSGVILIAAGFALLALVGAIDDRIQLPTLVRLPVHFLVSAICVWYLALPVGAALFLVVLMAWAINLFNFMDGSDGQVAAVCIMGFGFLGVLAYPQWLGQVSLVISGCMLGFILLNWHPAKTFMGDAGSTTLGLAAAAIGAAGWRYQLWSWLLPLALFSPLWIDASYTLTKRIVKQERVWEGHKTHLYQRLIQMGHSPKKVAVGYTLVGLAAGIISQRFTTQDLWVNLTSLAALLCCYLVVVLLLERTLR